MFFLHFLSWYQVHELRPMQYPYIYEHINTIKPSGGLYIIRGQVSASTLYKGYFFDSNMELRVFTIESIIE